jgi:hypothetical protein
MNHSWTRWMVITLCVTMMLALAAAATKACTGGSRVCHVSHRQEE